MPRVIAGANDSSPPSKVSPTEQVSQSSCFGDSIWDLSDFIHKTNYSKSGKCIRFDATLPDGSLLMSDSNKSLCVSTKEYLIARLRGYSSNRRPMNAETLKEEYSILRSLIEWMNFHGKNAYSQLTPYDIEISYLAHLRRDKCIEPALKPKSWHIGPRTGPRMARHLTVIQQLWNYRDEMSDSLSFNPFKGLSPYGFLGGSHNRNDENRTPVIPDEVMRHLSSAALDYVYNRSADIIKARAILEPLRKDLLARRRKGYSGRVNKSRGLIDSDYHIINAALARVIISNSSTTGEPWRAPFSNSLELYLEEESLFAACYFVIAWLTGMRESEITSLRTNCVSRELSADGLIERVKLRGTLFKGVPDPKGRIETWMTIEPAAKAVSVLADLTQWLRAKNNSPYLLLSGFRGNLNKVDVATNAYILRNLNAFSTRVDAPHVDGSPWRLTTRQFRRTLARWIGRRPFGEIAGMIQYKHLELATFEGYVGKDTEFLKDLEEETVLANIDLLEGLRDDLIGGFAAGPKAKDLVSTFRGIAGDRRIDDEAYMLKHLARTLFVGALNLCFYDPGHAMCQQHLPPEERKAPIMSHCHPGVCPNSCITRQHVGVWQSQLADVNKLLRKPKLPTPQRLALDQERGMIVRTIAPLTNRIEDN